MTEHISAMVNKGDVETIQNYVKHHLPNDEVGLQRIYKQLLQYNPNSNGKSQKIRKDSLKTDESKQKQLKRKKQQSPKRSDDENSADKQTRRTQKIIKNLKQRGLKRGKQDSQQKGMIVFQKNMSKLTNPLKTNSKVLRSGQAQIDNLIQRWNVNNKFYSNTLQETQLDLQSIVDDKMKEFLTRREKVLSNLINGKLQIEAPVRNSRYNFVENRVFQPAKQKVQYQEQPKLRRSEWSLQRLQKTKELLNNCGSTLRRRDSQKVINKNYFQQLQARISSDGQFLRDDKGQTFDTFGRMKEKLARQQFERYTHTYMNMVSRKRQDGQWQSKLNVYAKQLLRDARKMRNIIDFEKKN